MIKKIINSSFFLLIGTVINKVAMFVVNIVVARLLSQEVFGQYMFLRSSISMFDNIISASIGNVTVNKVAEYRDKIKELKQYILSLFIINLILLFTVSLLIYIFSDKILFHFLLNDNSLKKPLYISLFILFSTVFATLTQKINIGLSYYKEIAFMSIGSLFIGLPIILFLVNNYNLNGLLLGTALYFFIDFILKSSVYLRKQRKMLNVNFKINFRKNLKLIFKSSFLLIMSSIISSIAFWSYRVVIINKANSFINISFFDAAYQWAVIILLITGATTSVALQMLSDNKNNHIKVFRINLIVNIIIAILFASIFSFFAYDIMSIYGNDYAKYYNLIYIISITTILATIDSIYNKFFISKQKNKIIFFHSFISALAGVIFLFLAREINLSILLAITFFVYYFCFFILDTIYIFRNHKEYFL